MLLSPLFNKTVFFPSFLSEGGEMSQYILSHDWSGTTLGNMSDWPQSLQTTLSIMLHSRLPMYLCWGPDRIIFYNDAYIPMIQAVGRHPWALGRKGPVVWPSAWAAMESIIDHAIIGGGYTTLENQRIPLKRHGYHEEAYWTCNYSPVTIEDGYRGGVLVSFFETGKEPADNRQAMAEEPGDDLQQFVHVASHDLREPLRKIRIYSGRLDNEYGDMLPGKAQQYLDKIHRSVDRMFCMMDGILYYSRLNSGEQSIDSIDLNRLMANIGDDLEIMIAEKQAKLTYADLPIIEGVTPLIYQLFYNLIHNSLKFSKADETAVIQISHREFIRNGVPYAEITISDNGIGFDQEQAEKIFNTFAQLNPKEKYEGTGLGLALCRKIVHRHHGNITARGESNTGAEILITLPSRYAG